MAVRYTLEHKSEERGKIEHPTEIQLQQRAAQTE